MSYIMDRLVKRLEKARERVIQVEEQIRERKRKEARPRVQIPISQRAKEGWMGEI